MGEFEAFSSIALIFSTAVGPPLNEPISFNDDVHCAHYHGSLGSYMSFQRNKLHIDDLGATSRHQFVEESVKRVSPFSETSPIPEDIRRSINLLSSNSTDTIRAFWTRQMGHLRSLISGRQERSKFWYANAPPELSQFHRRLPMDAWAALMHFCGLGGARRLTQFAYGFHITGNLLQKFAFPTTAKKLPAQLSVGKVLAPYTSRFVSRAARPPASADTLWQEAGGQVARGWLGPPRILNSRGAI